MNRSSPGRRDDAAAEPPCPVPFTPWPSIGARRPVLATDARDRVERIAAALGGSSPVRRGAAYAAALAQRNVRSGWIPGPTLWAEDHRGIELVAESAARGFEYRSLALARDGDTLLISRPRDPTFERYTRETLGLGAPEVRRVRIAAERGGSLCAACLEDGPALDALVGAARRAGALTIAPYRSDGHAWRLGATVAAATGAPVAIAAPVPPLARAANDKLWFVDAARALLGRDALPPTWRVHGPAAAADRLARLARDHERLVIKTRASAGALGNVVIEAATLRGRSLAAIRHRLLELLSMLGGERRWPLLLGVWEEAVLSSPSLQCWVPPPAEGEPVLEGVYEQRLGGGRGVFIGASETTLAEPLAGELGREGLQLTLLLQRLGYVGRASFDALVVGSSWTDAKLHWLECNARWGGVSIPMSVTRRLGIGPGERATLIAQAPLDASRVSFERVLAATASVARRFDRASRTGLLWLTPPDAGRRGLTFLAVGTTSEAASALAAEAVAGLAALQRRERSD